MEVARKFHGYPAPGLIIGAYMVELAKSHMPGGVLYDAVSETSYCLPDAIQLLTPCTIGNGWMRILNFGLYAMSLYDKRTGEGVRVRLDLDRLDAWPSIRAWYMKTTPKKEQDSDLLQEEIYEAGISILSAQPVTVKAEYVGRPGSGRHRALRHLRRAASGRVRRGMPFLPGRVAVSQRSGAFLLRAGSDAHSRERGRGQGGPARHDAH